MAIRIMLREEAPPLSPFGIYVARILDEHAQTAAWLAAEIGIRPQTISAWKSRRTAAPSPLTVYKVAAVFERAFGVPRDQTAAAAGYPFRWSETPDAQRGRLDALVAASPRLARNLTRAVALPARELDELLSLVEAFLTAREGSLGRRHRRTRPPE